MFIHSFTHPFIHSLRVYLMSDSCVQALFSLLGNRGSFLYRGQGLVQKLTEAAHSQLPQLSLPGTGISERSLHLIRATVQRLHLPKGMGLTRSEVGIGLLQIWCQARDGWKIKADVGSDNAVRTGASDTWSISKKT